MQITLIDSNFLDNTGHLPTLIFNLSSSIGHSTSSVNKH